MVDGTDLPAFRRYQWERVLKDSEAGQTTVLVGLVLATYSNRDGTNAHPGIERLRRDCRLGSDKTVRSHLGKLVDLGLIVRTFEASPTGRKGLADVYKLVNPAHATTGKPIMDEVEPPVTRSSQARSTYRPPEHSTNDLIDHHSAKRSLPSQARVDDQTTIDPDDYDDEHEWLRDMLSSEFGRDLAPDEESTLYNWAAEGVHLKVIENAIRKLAREKAAVPAPRRTPDDWQDRVKGTRCPLCGVVGGVQCVDRNRKPLGPNSVHPERFDEAGVPRSWAAA